VDTLLELGRGVVAFTVVIAVLWLLGASGRRRAKMTPEQRELDNLRRRVNAVERHQRWDS
jgi:hypothetical protein